MRNLVVKLVGLTSKNEFPWEINSIYFLPSTNWDIMFINDIFNSLANNFRNKVYSTCSLTVVLLFELFSRDVEAKFIKGFIADISRILDIRKESPQEPARQNRLQFDYNLVSKMVRSLFVIYHLIHQYISTTFI